MAETKIADILEPELFLPYMLERTTQLSEIIQSGIVVRTAEFDRIASTEGGRTVNMPYWKDLTGAAEILSDQTPLTVNAITTAQDKAAIHIRGKAFGANDLAGILAGDDPMAAIAELLAGYRVRVLQAQLISTLQGIFKPANMAGNLLDIHKAAGTPDSSNFLTAASFIRGEQLMGDNKSKLTAVLMHSAVESHLRILDLIDFIPQSEGKPDIKFFNGKRVIIDDTAPVETIDGDPVYSTFLFGQGAIAWGNSSKNDQPEGGEGTWQVEYGRNPLAHGSYIINRWRNILHPRGVAWEDSSVAGVSPTDAEIELQANWSRVYDPKNVRIVKIRHNIAAA